eukprot:8852006-Karenia_brevis.AAC.2
MMGGRKMRFQKAEMSGHPRGDGPEKSINARFKVTFGAVMGKLIGLYFNQLGQKDIPGIIVYGKVMLMN